MHGPWLFAHLIGVVLWIGGMFFAVVCLHPSLAALAGKDRVALIVPTLGRFFAWVSGAIVLIWLSGVMMALEVLRAPAGRMPVGWHVMIGAALLMTLLFGHLRFALFRRVRNLVAGGDPGPVPALLGRIRQLVIVNLGLGLVAIAGVTLLR